MGCEPGEPSTEPPQGAGSLGLVGVPAAREPQSECLEAHREGGACGRGGWQEGRVPYSQETGSQSLLHRRVLMNPQSPDVGL